MQDYAWLIGMIIGATSGYVMAYVNQKGKNRALRQDIQDIEQQKQKIISEYAKDLEALKRDHTLEIEHRRFQYQDMRDMYAKFCSELDTYQLREKKLLDEKIQPAIFTYFKNVSDGNDLVDASACLFKEIMLITTDLTDAFTQLKNQSNQLRLSSSSETESLIDELLNNMKTTNERTSSLVHALTSASGNLSTKAEKDYSQQFNQLNHENITIRNKLIVQMKRDLQTF